MTGQRILFLDFDGVLITSRSRWAALTPEGFDPVAARWIHALVRRAGAQVVISSSWRQGEDRFSMDALLTRNGLVDLPLHADWATPVLHTERQAEIDHWLGRHPDTTHHLILDDGIGLNEHSAHFVLTDIDNGLSFLHMLRSCGILGVDVRAWAEEAGIRLSASDLYALRCHRGCG